MGLFTKKTRTHFERDEAGNVTSMTRNGEPYDPRMKTSEQLEREHRTTHPTRWDKYRERRTREREAYREGWEEARMKRITQGGRRAGSTTITDRLDNFSKGFSMPRSSGYSTRNNYNPFGSVFDTGVKPMKRSKSKSSTKKYVIRGGKAYPIAGSKKTKSKKHSKKRSDDPFNNWRL